MRTNVATCNLHPMAFLLVATHIQPICTIVWTHPHMHMKIPAHIEECKILLQLNIHLVGKFLNAAPKKGVGFEPTTCTSMHWKMLQVVTFIDSIVFKYFSVILNCWTASSKTFWWRKWFFMRRSNYIYLGSKEKRTIPIFLTAQNHHSVSRCIAQSFCCTVEPLFNGIFSFAQKFWISHRKWLLNCE